MQVLRNAPTLFLLLLGLWTKGQILFGPPVHYPVSTGPQGIACADMNADGKMDIVVANGGCSCVTLLTGTGTGSFNPGVNIWGTGFIAKQPVCTDVNNDGIPDIVTANNDIFAGISVILGQGAGTFSAPQNLNFNVGFSMLDCGDLNSDGIEDLIVVRDDTTLYQLRGNGLGGFNIHDTVPTPKSTTSVRFVDVDGDGMEDIVTSDYFYSNTASVFQAIGNGTFGVPISHAAGNGAVMAVDGDFDNDGDVDLAVCNTGPSTISILQNVGSGVFSSPIAYAVGWYPLSAVTADFDQDGNLDLATANYLDTSITVMRGLGNCLFGGGTRYKVLTGPFGIKSSDFNGDNLPDLAVSNEGANKISVLLNMKNTAVASATDTYFALVPNPASSVVDIISELKGDEGVVQIHSLEGKLLHQHALVSKLHSIDVAGLAKGVYIVSVKERQRITYQKLIKH